MKKLLNKYHTKDMCLLYLLDTEARTVGFTIVSADMENRFTLAGDWKVESLLQIKRVGDSYPVGFSGGHTMRNSETCSQMKYVEQQLAEKDGMVTVTTVLKSGCLRGLHKVSWGRADESITVWCEIETIGTDTEKLEMAASFSLCSVFGFSDRERTADLCLHRLRSKWSEEGRLESRGFLELQLEPSWQNYGVQSIRYGQVGSMPVRRFFPWFVIEDTRYGCMLGGSMDAAASWQIEVFSEDARPAVSGGVADREFGHWLKSLRPGERFVTPPAELTCCMGGMDDISSRITDRQRENFKRVPDTERELPIIFNEFCTTWGSPTEEKVEALAARLEGRKITYCVIDSGWYAEAGKSWESNMGDWIPSRTQFPSGLKAAADAIRAHGMIPGLWFEVESCGKEADLYKKEDMLLHRDGILLTTARRRFLDMRKPQVWKYLDDRVIGCLKENGFGYLKVDYNDTIGIGCDGEESPGENLRVQMESASRFYRRIRECLPELVMENCSSGGHRLEPSMMRLFSMASFSDAHECVSEPIIAANLHRAIQPAQSQIWAVLRADADEKRMRYILAGTFLGRMCLSGDVDHLSEKQWELVDEAIAFYRKCAGIIRDGKSFRFGPAVRSYAHPKGYQVVVRKTEEIAIVVVHTFDVAVCGEHLKREGISMQEECLKKMTETVRTLGCCQEEKTVEAVHTSECCREKAKQSVLEKARIELAETIPVLAGYRILDSFRGKGTEALLDGNGRLCICGMKEFDAMVLLVKKK